MNTFFINTSKYGLSEYKDLYDIYSENKELVFMDCPLSHFLNCDKDYSSCLKKIDDLIEGYYELTDAYNLIIYIDLSEHRRTAEGEFAGINSLNEARRDVYTHIISETIISDLSAQGRKPMNTLIMFGCDKEKVRNGAESTEAIAPCVDEELSLFLGIPTKEQVQKISDEAKDGKTFFEKLNVAVAAIPSDKIVKFYDDIKNDWAEYVKTHAAADNEENGAENIISRYDDYYNPFKKVRDIYQRESREIQNIYCPYEYYAGSENMRVEAENGINVIIYLIRCITDPKFFGKDFTPYGSDKIVDVLKTKKCEFEVVHDEIKKSGKSFTELKLAPELYALDHGKFGLDEYGGDDGAPESPVLAKIKDYPEQQGTNSEPEKVDPKPNRNALPRDYDTEMDRLRASHAKFIRETERYTDEKLSNYAVVSREHKGALLDEDSDKCRYTYTDGNKKKETMVLKSVEKLAEDSYKSVINRYVSARPDMWSLSQTDIENECDEFKSKRDKIQEELDKASAVAVILLVLIAALYVPFFVIQFEAITKNLLSIIIAAVSVAVPIAIVFIVFAKVYIKRKRELVKAWEEFCDKADKKIEANEKVKSDFTSYLNRTIPSLRYVYEYKLDVENYAEHCRVADAKIDYHRKKLSERIKAMERLINDISLDGRRSFKEEDKAKKAKEEELIRKKGVVEVIDLNSAYCCGDKNQELYSVVDKLFNDGKSAAAQGEN